MFNSQKNILVIDYQIGNVSSVINAVKKLGYKVKLSNKKDDFNKASHLILPGVGSFEVGMANIIKSGIKDIIIDYVRNKKIPILGICLGMQLFATEGYENAKGHENKTVTKGLNLIEGEVIKLESKSEKLPHIGWNTVYFKKKNQLNKDLEPNRDFYFVHSYCFKCTNDSEVLGTTNYGSTFTSIIKKNNIYGMQFHPEKSLDKGLTLLKNFLEINA